MYRSKDEPSIFKKYVICVLDTAPGACDGTFGKGNWIGKWSIITKKLWCRKHLLILKTGGADAVCILRDHRQDGGEQILRGRFGGRKPS